MERCRYNWKNNNITDIVKRGRQNLLITGRRKLSVSEKNRPRLEELYIGNSHCILDKSINGNTNPPFIILGLCTECLYDIEATIEPLGQQSR